MRSAVGQTKLSQTHFHLQPPACKLQAVFLFLCTGQGEEHMEPISVVIITFNEEQNIRNCILSVQIIASEVLILDSGSTDNTVRIAKALGARVETHPFDGHIQQKNRAKDMASHEWVLSLDADERLSPLLAESIANVMENPQAAGYTMNRLNHYCKKPIKGCGWYPDTKLRLWKKTAGAWGGVNPHDRFELHQGGPEHIKGDILHFTYNSREEMKSQSKKFARIAAREFMKLPWHYLIFKLLFSPISKFFKTFFLQRGLLEGINGLEVGWYQTREVFHKYALAIAYKFTHTEP